MDRTSAWNDDDDFEFGTGEAQPDPVAPLDPLSPQYDPFRDHNFKWIANGETGEAAIWHVFGTDGRGQLVHRDAAMNAWGRPLDPYQDWAGLCKYEAPTRNMAGQITTPPKFYMFSYWRKDFPDSVIDGFKKIFPGTAFYVSDSPGVSSRKPLFAKSGPVTSAWDDDEIYEDDGEANVYKWAWAEGYPVLLWKTDDQGRPWHDEKIRQDWYRAPLMGDTRGYAVQNDSGQWEIETYGMNVNNQALQDAKRALIAEIPDAQIVMPFDYEDAGGSTVVSYAPNTDRHEAAALWAQEHFGAREVDHEREPVTPSEGYRTAQEATQEQTRVNPLSKLVKRFRKQKQAGWDDEPAWEPQEGSWSGWKGALRFATDGTNVLTEPEPLDGSHGGGHPQMAEEFRQRFPEHKGKLSFGWLVPTINEDGYGMILYDGPIDKVWNTLEKHIGKPIHLTEGTPRNPLVYALYPQGGQLARPAQRLT